MTGPGPLVNPFRVPGIEFDQPLYPNLRLDHGRWYVDVDHTGPRYTEFCTEFRAAVARSAAEGGPDGRLFVVYGRERCGKTSFVNRCAHWVHATRLGTVCDVRNATTVRTVQVKRLREVARRVAAIAHAQGLISVAPDPAWEEPGVIYPWLNDQLAEDAVLVVLLPVGTDVSGEIAEYSRFAERHLVFLLESVHQEDQDEEMTEIRQNGFRPPVVLELGGMTAGDIVTFVERRLTGESGESGEPSGDHPMVSTPDLAKLSDMPMTIGQLQALLYRVYQQRLDARKRYSRIDSVTYQELLGWIVRWALEHGWGEVDER